MRLRLRKVKDKKIKKNKFNEMMFMLVTIFVLSFSVGYAALNREVKISGEAKFRPQEDIRITNISLSEIVNNGLENYESDYSKNTIKLGVDLKELASTITYKVEITNLGNVAMWIDSVEQPINNNTNMEYVIEGIGLRELINPGDVKEFTVTIKYKDDISMPSNTNLDTTIKFNFVKPESILARGNDGAETSTFYNGTIAKESVEEITFLPTLEVGEDAIGYWDASYNKDGSVIAWYKDSDNNDLYELYIGGIGEVEAPVSSASLFRNFTSLTNINFNDYFKAEGMTLMQYMFSNCPKLEELDLSFFNTSNVTNMLYMFYGCSSLTNLNVSSFDTSRVTSMSQMFHGCSKLTELNLSSFNVSNVNNMYHMFNGCSSLTELDLSSFNTEKVTTMQNMFGECSKLESLDLSNFDTSNVTSMSNMFYGCSSLININLSNFDTSNVTSMSEMFSRCSSLTQLDLSSFNTSQVTNMYCMFRFCNGLTDLDISLFNTENVTTMFSMFQSCSSLTHLDLSSFNTSKVTTMQNMFLGCSSLTKLDLSSFNTSNVKNMNAMFQSCSKLSDIDVTSFDTSNVTDMGAMFRECPSLTRLDLSNFNTSNVTSIWYMFFASTKLTELDIRNFDFAKVTSYDAAFAGMPGGMTIYVKDETAKEFVLNRKSDANVIIPESL